VTFFFFILILNWLTGFGVIASLRTRLPRTMSIPLAPLVGMFVHTVLLFLLDLLPWGIGPGSMTMVAVIGLVMGHLRWPLVKSFYRELFATPQWTLKMYDVVLIIGTLITAYVVFWAAWFWPVTPFDAMAGIDLVARETVREGTINNTVFTDPALAGHLSNQPFYAPYAMLMQVIYRLIGFGYGQVWLAVSALLFSWFLFAAMRQVAHPFVAGVLWLLAILTPEFLGYTYLLQTDYVNAVFLSSAVILTALSAEREEISALGLAAVLFAAASWSRTETILLVGLGLAATAPYLLKRLPKRMVLTYLAWAFAASLLMFVVWNGLYLQVILPVRPDTASELAMFDVGRFASVSADLFSVMANTEYWGMAFPLFVLVFAVSAIRYRSIQPLVLLLWIGAITLGLVLVGTVFTAAVVEQTLRRGIFKLIPLLFLAVAWTPLLRDWSARLLKWETGR